MRCALVPAVPPVALPNCAAAAARRLRRAPRIADARSLGSVDRRTRRRATLAQRRMAAVSARFARALTKTLVGGGNGAVQSLSCADHRIAGANAMFNKLVAHLDSIKARDPEPRSRWEIPLRSEERRGGKRCVRTWRTRGS